jgi:hypothetical protein
LLYLLVAESFRDLLVVQKHEDPKEMASIGSERSV